MRHAAVWMGFVYTADVIAERPGRGARDGLEKVGMVGRGGFNDREKWRVRRLSRLSMRMYVVWSGYWERLGVFKQMK